MVEWKKMWEVTTWDKKFTGVDKQMQPKVIKYYYYLANELSELESKDGDIRILYTTDKVAYAKAEDVEDNISEGEVVTIPWGGNVCIKYYKGKFITADNRIATSNNTNILANKFLFYWMLSQKDEIEKFYRGAGIKHPSMLSVLSMSIPLPSLSEQERIVGILDTFTSSIENLKAQISLRRKQYEHYRDKLLDLEGKPGVEMKTLGEIVSSDCSLSYGIVQPGDDVIEGIPVVRPVDLIGQYVIKDGLKKTTKEISDSYKRTILKGNEVLFCVRGTTGVMSLASQELEGCNVTRGIVPISFDDELTKMFVYYQLKSYRLQRTIADKTNGTALKQINIKDLRLLSIPLPSLQEQSRIVSILDEFEASIKNLEAQLEAREKQYEYYREKLLTFERE